VAITLVLNSIGHGERKSLKCSLKGKCLAKVDCGLQGESASGCKQEMGTVYASRWRDPKYNLSGTAFSLHVAVRVPRRLEYIEGELNLTQFTVSRVNIW
jgi:hypothetical protein